MPFRQLAGRAILVAGVGAAGFLLLSMVGLDDAEKWASFISGFVAFLLLCLGFANWLGRQRGQVGDELVAEVLRDVSVVVVQRRAALQARGVTLADPFPVPWTLVDSPDQHTDRPPSLGASGFVSDLAAALASGPVRGVVVLGCSGAGKSTIAELALLQHAQQSAQGGLVQPLPLRVHLGTWNPGEELTSWAVRQVLRACREAGSRTTSRRAVRAAISSGALHLLLDGLDELPEAYRRRALARIREAGLPRFVLLTQPTAYADELHGAADVVELGALSGEDAKRALTPGLRRRREDWAAVARRVTEEPDEPLAIVLRRPLYLSLARRMRDEGLPAPSVLRDRTVNAAALEAALLTGVIGAAFSEDGPRVAGQVAYPRERAKAYLGTVADVMAADSRENFLWWRLPSLIPWWVQAAGGALFTYLLVHWVFEVGLGLSDLGATTLAVIAVFVLAAEGDARPPWPWRRKLLATAPRRLGATCAVLLMGSIIIDSLADRLTPGQTLKGLIASLVYGLIIAALLGGIGREMETSDRGARWLGQWREDSPPRRAGWRVTPGKVLLALGFGGLAGFIPLASQLLALTGSPQPPVGSVARGLLALFVATGLITLAASYGAAIPASPSDRLGRAVRSNLWYGATAGLLWTLTIVLVVLVMAWSLEPVSGRESWFQGFQDLQRSTGLESWQIVLLVVGVLVVLGLAVSVVGMTVSSAGRFALASTLLFLGGRWPWPTAAFAFLRAAHDRGLLRQSGHSYAFAHVALRQVLSRGRTQAVEEQRERASV